jgi:hypothetical protein
LDERAALIASPRTSRLLIVADQADVEIRRVWHTDGTRRTDGELLTQLIDF